MSLSNSTGVENSPIVFPTSIKYEHEKVSSGKHIKKNLSLPDIQLGILSQGKDGMHPNFTNIKIDLDSPHTKKASQILGIDRSECFVK